MASAHSIKQGDVIELYVEKLVYGGEALARKGNLVCFVDNGLPGEHIRAHVDKVHSHYLKTTLIEINQTSAYRVQPPCTVFRQCGGCHWQHLAYQQQLLWKQEIIADCLSRITGAGQADVLTPIPSPKTANYRIKANLKVFPGPKLRIGYFMRRSHTIIPIVSCALLVDQLNNALQAAPRLFNSIGNHPRSIIDLNLLCILKHDLVKATVGGSVLPEPVYFKSGIVLQSPSDESMIESINGMQFYRNNRDFCQVNFEQNVQLIDVVLEHIGYGSHKSILELYCGCGNFSLFLARLGAVVTGIDISKAAIREAALNARLNGIVNSRFIAADLHADDFSLPEGTYDAVLLNPPRSGCAPHLLRHILISRPRTVVYVSCNPATLARDLRSFLSAGYQPCSIQPVDMFPQTYHIETVVKLSL